MNFQSLILTVTSVLLTITLFAFVLMNRPAKAARHMAQPVLDLSAEPETGLATFGTGCFWCTEAIFESIEGVIDVKSGYSGGNDPNPTYESVCSGTTGHAEVVHIEFDPNRVSFNRLLEAFWLSHDPTTLNRQGADVGTQYRSVVFYHNESQRQVTEKYKRMFNDSGAFDAPIVTEISKFSEFHVAENYHQDYFRVNGHKPYCQYNITPKLQKFKKAFAELDVDE